MTGHEVFVSDRGVVVARVLLPYSFWTLGHRPVARWRDFRRDGEVFWCDKHHAPPEDKP